MKYCASLVVTFILFGSLVGSDCSAKEPMNVLFIAVDDLNDWVEFLGGHPQAKTPNMDRLAKRGVVFTHAYCSAPGCNGSRSSLLTGKRPSSTGVYANAHDWRTAPKLKGAITLPLHFKKQGYLTLGAGKLFHSHTFFDKKWLTGFSHPEAWHDYFPSKTQQMPEEKMPDEWPVNTVKGTKMFYKGHFDWAPLAIPNKEMADAQVVNWITPHLAKKHAKPLFLSVVIYRPHQPWYVPQKYFDRFPLDSIQLPKSLQGDLDDVPEAGKKNARRKWHKWIVEHNQWKKAVQGYLASQSFADDMVGQVLDALNHGPMAKNTIIVFWGDHGYHLGEKESWEKFALWEDTTHVPLIIVDPSGKNAGTTCDTPVSLLDIYPTLVELCGLPSPAQKLEGQSLATLLSSPGTKMDRVAVTTHGKDNHAIRSQRYRYIRYADGSEELYDHKVDRYEWTNLAARPASKAIKDRLAAHLPKVNVEPIPVEKK